MNPKQRYKHQIYHSLAGFQLLEQSIKDYLAAYYYAIKLALISELKLPFEYSVNRFDNMPLGTLHKELAKAKPKDEVIIKIESLFPKRKLLAHKSLALVYDTSQTDEQLESEVNSYIEVSKEISLINKYLNIETKNLIELLQNKYNLEVV